jgi:hypothetical protein
MIDTAFLFDHGDDSPLVIVVLYKFVNVSVLCKEMVVAVR